MVATLFALAAGIALGQTTPAGARGVFTLPTPATTPDGQIELGLSGAYWRGGDFLLPDATSQRTATSLAASAGFFGGVLETFGAISLTSSNLISDVSRRTLVSAGDADVGVKLLIPGQGPFSAGVLLELDLPAGVGGFSLKGAGGRAGAMLAYRMQFLRASALAGYRLDNSAKLMVGQPATFSAWALSISSYDVAYGGAAVEGSFVDWLTLAIELVAESPVARSIALPEGQRPLRARAAVGLEQVHTGLPGVTLSAALQLSLSRDGRISDRQIPVEGFAPDPPWTVLAGLSWQFERPAPRREVQWHEPLAQLPPPAPPQPALAQKKPKGALRVTVLDAKSALPLAGAWVSFIEGSEIGGTTGPDGKVRVESEPGSATMAVARDGYELLTQPVTVASGEERQLTVLMQQVAPDASVRGRLVGEDGLPLRAAVVLSVPGTPPALPAEPQVFEGAFDLAVQHGSYELNAIAPGYRCTPIQVELRPGETSTRDLQLRRIAGESRVRASAHGLEIAVPIGFAKGLPGIDPSAHAAMLEVLQALKGERRALEVVARVAPGELADEAAALRLSEARAQAVIEFLKLRGVRAGQLTSHGAGRAREGQPLLEFRVTPQGPRAENETHTGVEVTSDR
ncbi:MAG TPA: carboxypeptidase regulatory-like domain-containing protein [Myxococcales bacterium]|nr:carboxypeptidase regulatory-like domain-containing protein [Myxococcales bacterium]